MIKVSVIVAVYNAGGDIKELLASIDAQSMPSDEFEVIFVDDDSTDGSRERLEQWAADRPHVRVLHNTPNSGWPGRPRNLGIDAARGEYLFFADNDDKLAPRALEWMHRYARANDSDVVIPKLVGIGPGRGVPRQLFRRNIVNAKLGKHPILGILTPHKLVRTAMVREHDIRFPEGRIRLEDHFFIVSCFFAAQRISVFADQVCYYWMRRVADGENASFAPVDPVMYYQSVERILEVVERNTEPGELRDKLYAHWYEGKMLSRLRGGSLLEKTPEYQQSLFDELRRVSERFGLGQAQWRWLGAGGRLRSHLLQRATLQDVQVLAAAERGVTQDCELEGIGWTPQGRLEVQVRSQLTYHDGRPIRVVHDGDTVWWDAPDLVPSLDVPQIEITDLYRRIRLDVVFTMRGSEHHVEFVSDCTSEVVENGGLTARARFVLDPITFVDPKGRQAIVDLRARLGAAGWISERRVPAAAPDELPEPQPVAVATAYGTQGYGKLSLAVGRPAPTSPDQDTPTEPESAALDRPNSKPGTGARGERAADAVRRLRRRGGSAVRSARRIVGRHRR